MEQKNKSVQRHAYSGSFGNLCNSKESVYVHKMNKKDSFEHRSSKSTKEERLEKIQHLEEMKRSQLDDLNDKIKHMIDRISDEETPIQSFVR
jgi:hypothetical protein